MHLAQSSFCPARMYLACQSVLGLALQKYDQDTRMYLARFWFIASTKVPECTWPGLGVDWQNVFGQVQSPQIKNCFDKHARMYLAWS